MFPEAHGSSIGTIYIQNTESPRHRTLSGGPPPFGKGGFSALTGPPLHKKLRDDSGAPVFRKLHFSLHFWPEGV